MTLYDIDSEILSIGEKVFDITDTETGEITDIDLFEEFRKQLDALQGERDAKISNIACWYKSLKAEADAIKTEKLNLEKRQKAAENKAESLKKYLDYALNGEKFKDPRVSISYRKSESVSFDEGFNYDLLPEQFKKVTVEPKKTEIKNFLKTGASIDGCYIQEKVSMQIK